MSYDIEVWFETEPITVEAAIAKLERWSEHDDLSGFTPSRHLLDFHRDLMQRYPPLEGEDDDDCPWSMTPKPSDRLVAMNIIWPKAAETHSVISVLAGEHGLVCFDSFDELVHPPAMVNAQCLQMWTHDGSRAFGPDLATIDQMLASLTEKNWFAVLERPDGWYIQIGYGAGDGPPHWFLEYREGTADRHFQTEVAAPDGLGTVFRSFAEGDYSWQIEYSWQRLEFE